MSTFRQLIYMVADLAKQVSDDDTLTNNHIAFLLKKYRSYLLKQKYAKSTNDAPDSNYQTVCAKMESVSSGVGCTPDCYDLSGNLLRSVDAIGEPLSFGDTKISIFKCPGEYSIALDIIGQDKSINAEQVEYINCLFDYYFSQSSQTLYKDFTEDEHHTITSTPVVYTCTSTSEGKYTIECSGAETTFNLWYSTDSQDKDKSIYSTSCSDDVDTVIELLKKQGINAYSQKVAHEHNACSEKEFYTTAIKKYGNISSVENSSFSYVGLSKYNKNGLYGTIGMDGHLYVKSNKELDQYNMAIVTSMFEDPEDAYTKSACTYEYEESGQDKVAKCPEGGSCDPWDMQFPLEDSLQPALINLVLKDILGAAYRPIDGINNGVDDLADIVRYVRQNMKQQYVNQTKPTDVE